MSRETTATKSLLTGMIDGVVSTGIGSILFTIFGLLGFILSSRWLTKEELGTFVILQLVVGFVVGVSSLGLELSVTKFIAESEDAQRRQEILNTVISFRLLTIFVSSGLALLLRQPLFRLFGESPLVSMTITYIPILVLFESLTRMFDSVLSGYFQFRWMAFLSVITSFVNFILIIVLLGWQDLGLPGRIWARLIALIITVIAAVLWGGLKFHLRINFSQLWGMIKFSFPLFINYILSFVFMRADTFIIGGFLGVEEIAVYEIARKIPESIESMYDSFRKVFFPYMSGLFARQQNALAAQVLNHSLRLITFTGVLGTLVAFLFGKEIIILLFSGQYSESGFLFGLLMVVLTMNVIDYTLGYSLVAVGESNKPPLINTVHTAVNFLGYFTLIPLLGVVGAALATLLGIVVVNPINLFFLKRKQIAANAWTYGKPVLLGLGCFLLTSFMLADHWLVDLLVLLFYVALSFLMHTITADDIVFAWEWIQHQIHRRKPGTQP